MIAKIITYYAGIMLDASAYLLCSKLCRHNPHRPTVFEATILLQAAIIIRNALHFFRIFQRFCNPQYLILGSSIDLLGHIHHHSSISLAVGLRQLPLLSLEPVQGLERHMQLARTVKLGKVGDDKLRVGEGGGERFLGRGGWKRGDIYNFTLLSA